MTNAELTTMQDARSKRIYLDHAATSFPKPACVTEEMVRYAEEVGASAGRGAYQEAQESGRIISQCRDRIRALVNGTSSSHVIFTLNCSDALNLAIHGILGHADPDSPAHAVTTWLDHNSVLRPLNELASQGRIQQSRVRCDGSTGLVDPDDIRKAIRPETKLVAVVHGSNVTGTLQPVDEIGALCREYEVPFLVDAAQSAGNLPIDMGRMNIDLLAMPGHKGLLGPLGTGVLCIRPGVERMMRTVRQGGTGSVSEHDTQPEFMPDRFEPGSHNAIGIAGLNAALEWLEDRGIQQVRDHEARLMQRMIDHLEEAPSGLTWYGPRNLDDRCGVFSVSIKGWTSSDLSNVLESRFGLLTRPGLHCAPLAHRTIGTYESGGTVRLSIGV